MKPKKILVFLCAVMLLCSSLLVNVSAAQSPVVGSGYYTIYDGNTAWDFLKAAANGKTKVYIGNSNSNKPLYSDRALTVKSGVYVKAGKTILVTITDAYKQNGVYGVRIKYNNKTYYVSASSIIPIVDFLIYDYQLTNSIKYYTIIKEKKGNLTFDGSDITSTKNVYPVLGTSGTCVVVYNPYNEMIVCVYKSDFFTKPYNNRYIALETKYDYYAANPKMLSIQDYSVSVGANAQVKPASWKEINNKRERYEFKLVYDDTTGLYMIKNTRSGYYLEVKDVSNSSSRVRQYSIREGKSRSRQQFQLIQDGESIFIRSRLGTYMYSGTSSSNYVGVLKRSSIKYNDPLKWKVWLM